MANQFSKGHVFVPGEVVDPDDLNNLVDLATALPGLISEQGAPVTPVAADEVLILQSGALKTSRIDHMPQGVTSIGMTVNPTSVFASPGLPNPIVATGSFAVSLKQQQNNKVLVSPVDGSLGDTGFRALLPPDITPPTTLILTGLNVDFTLSNVFCYTLPSGVGPYTFHIVNPIDGQTVKIRIRQNGGGDGRVSWAAPVTLVWVEGTQPEFTTAPNAYGTYVFTVVRQIGVTTIHAYLESVGNVTNVSATATPTSVFNVNVANPTSAPAIALSLDTQVENTFLAGPAIGADAVPTFRALSPHDTAGIVEVPAHIIDCSLGNNFRRVLAGTVSTDTLHINNGLVGQRILIYLIQGANPGQTAVAWTTDDGSGIIRWPNSAEHTMSTGAVAVTDIVYFFCIGAGQYYGTYDKNFVP